jgi:hypothetical protein
MYLSEVTLAQNGQEVKVLETNLARLVTNTDMLRWLLLKESIQEALSAIVCSLQRS